MQPLSKAELIERARSKPKAFPIKALEGAEVLVKRMTAAQAEDYFSGQLVDVNGKREFGTKDARANLIALCVVFEDGSAISVEEARALDNDVSSEIAQACREHNGLEAKAEEAKKD